MTQTKSNHKQLESPDFLRQLVQTYLQEYLEQEMAIHLGALPYERTESRQGHRNGYPGGIPLGQAPPAEYTSRQTAALGPSDPGRLVLYRAF